MRAAPKRSPFGKNAKRFTQSRFLLYFQMPFEYLPAESGVVCYGGEHR